MKLLFLGTGSAKCKKIPEGQAPDGARRCSSTLLDGTVQVDVPIHTYDFLEKRGISPADVTDIFLTHSHGDHYWKETLLRYAKAGERKLNFYCNTGAIPYLELTEEEAKTYFAQINASGAISDDELDTVAGGMGCSGSEDEEEVTKAPSSTKFS